MEQVNFEQFSDAAKKMQAPLQELAELNAKTLQGLAFLKPEELMTIKKPEDLIEKQVGMALENGRKAIDYLQQSFAIMEKSFKAMVDDVKVKAKK